MIVSIVFLLCNFDIYLKKNHYLKFLLTIFYNLNGIKNILHIIKQYMTIASLLFILVKKKIINN